MRKPFVALDLSDVANIDHLHRLLFNALAFPAWYGKNWDAFWDAITGLVEMPEQLQLVGWDTFEKRFPNDARIMKRCLDDLSEQLPALATKVDYS